MSPSGPADPTAAVVPRWEWRTFGDLENVNEFLAALLAEPAAESEETYVLSRFSNASVKVRDGLMDAKVLRRVTGMGLELWEPTMKARFPLDGAALATMFEALGLPPSHAPDGRSLRGRAPRRDPGAPGRAPRGERSQEPTPVPPR